MIAADSGDSTTSKTCIWTRETVSFRHHTEERFAGDRGTWMGIIRKRLWHPNGNGSLFFRPLLRRIELYSLSVEELDQSGVKRLVKDQHCMITRRKSVTSRDQGNARGRRVYKWLQDFSGYLRSGVYLNVRRVSTPKGVEKSDNWCAFKGRCSEG